MFSVNHLTTSISRLRKKARAAFSLIEVSVSLSVISFAFIGVVGLMANGIEQFRGAIDSTVTAQIAQRILADAQQAEFDTLIDADHLPALGENADFSFRAPKVTQPALRYFDEQGNEVIPAGDTPSASEIGRIVYHVNTRIRPWADVPADTDAQKPHLAQVTVQVAASNGAAQTPVDLGEGPTQNLFALPKNRPVFTYSALVSRSK